MKCRIAAACGAWLCWWAPHAHAQAGTDRDAGAPASWSQAVARATESGSYLPLSVAPQVGLNHAQAAGLGGYDGAKQSSVLRSFAEARLYRSLALRVGTRFTKSSQRVGPSVGARAQLLSEHEDGLAASVALFYQAEGFTEAEGEIETTVSVGRRLGRVLVVGNLTYGQDPEGRERDGEVSAACLLRLAAWAHLGVDARGRFDLGSGRARLRANHEPMYDVDAGPVLQLAVGPLAVGIHGGASVLERIGEPTRVGVAALAGLGTAF